MKNTHICAENKSGKGDDLRKLNCWEFKKCGREPGGVKANELGVCPTSTETSLDGVHGGENAGRACWIVAGSMCGGKVQGTFAQKYDNCKDCDFYLMVREDEKTKFELSTVLLRKLRNWDISFSGSS